MDTTHGPDLALLAALRRAVGAGGTAEAARELAGAGVPVLPCVQGSTRPLNQRGPGAASVDPDRVAWWWSRYPSTNLAVPTGSASGLDVLELHPGPGPRSGFGALRRAMRAGLVPAPGLMVATPSGGLHLFFPHPSDTAHRSWSAPGSGIGFHGDGGYVVLPPSLVQRPDGAVARYRPIGPSPAAPAPVDIAALHRFLDPATSRVRLAARAPAPAGTPEPARASGAAVDSGRTAVSHSAATSPGGARPMSRPDPGGVDRRPSEVVSL